MTEVEDADRICSLLSTESMSCLNVLNVLETNNNERTKEFEEVADVRLSVEINDFCESKIELMFVIFLNKYLNDACVIFSDILSIERKLLQSKRVNFDFLSKKTR